MRALPSTARCYSSKWANISKKKCFQHLVESIPCRIKAVLKAKGGQTKYYGVPNNPLDECISTFH